MLKAEIRQIYKANRNALLPEQRQYYSEQIRNMFFANFDLQHIQAIHLFIPIPGKSEVDTWHIINTLQVQFPNIDAIVPRCIPDGCTMESFRLLPSTILVSNEWGIMEPATAEVYNPLHIDIVLLPLLAFDESGQRVGYGKGFYDRFLESCRKEVVKVGLSYFPAITIIDDAHENDIALDYCITPDRLYRFTNK